VLVAFTVDRTPFRTVDALIVVSVCLSVIEFFAERGLVVHCWSVLCTLSAGF
jgi:hypothetical protein